MAGREQCAAAPDEVKASRLAPSSIIDYIPRLRRMHRPTFRPRRLPALVRAYNGVHHALERVGVRRRWFDAAELMARATRATGLSDFGGDEFREPLGVLLGSLERSQLSAFGRRGMRRHVIRALEKRLQVEACVRANPAILAERIVRPLFIVGLPRTGSTHLHHLLAAAPGVRAPLFWQLLWPVPPPELEQRDSDPRIARARRAIRLGLMTMPELAVLHAHAAEQPEECQFLLDAAFMNPLLPAGDDYERWWQSADLGPGYAYYEKQLKLYQWRWPGRYWVLKAPFHLRHLAKLLATFPDARFVFTHRTPREVVPSAASYAAIRSRMFYQRFDAAALGREVLESLGSLIDASLDARSGIEPARLVDVAYRDLVSDPLAAAARIHASLGEPFDDEARAALARMLERSPRHAHGQHRYRAGDFGLTHDAIDRRFARYAEFCMARGIAL